MTKLTAPIRTALIIAVSLSFGSAAWANHGAPAGKCVQLSSSQAEAALHEARVAYISGSYARARMLADWTLSAAPGEERAHLVVGAASCYLKDAARAQSAAMNLSTKRWMLLADTCLRNGVSLSAAPSVTELAASPCPTKAAASKLVLSSAVRTCIGNLVDSVRVRVKVQRGAVANIDVLDGFSGSPGEACVQRSVRTGLRVEGQSKEIVFTAKRAEISPAARDAAMLIDVAARALPVIVAATR